MAVVSVRRFPCSLGTGPRGELKVVPNAGATGRRDVRLSAVVRTNAFALPLPRRARLDSLVHELGLLLSYLHHERSRPLAARAQITSTSGHIRRFVSEATGMGLLSAMAVDHFGWHQRARRLANFDSLPPRLRKRYGTTKTRPDLLFALTDGPLAGEARCRYVSKVPGTTSPKQRARLDRLAAWSAAHGDHRWCMSWTWLTATGTTVDLFYVDPVAGTVAPTPARDDDIALRAAPTGPDPNPEVGAAAREAALWQSAEDLAIRGRLLDREIRGLWVDADRFGDGLVRLFLGILEERLTPNEEEAVSERVREVAPEEPGGLSVDVGGRVVVAIARGDTEPFVEQINDVLGRPSG